MDNLYYGDNCSCCDGFHNAGIRFSPEILESFLDKVYDGFDTRNEIEPAMWREVLRLLNEATAEGVSRAKTPPTHEEGFYRALRQSNEVFAAFKVHSMGEKMAAKLMTPEGKLKPFRQWVEDVKGISSHYVGSWLKTEYDTAIIRAHTAADWQRFEEDKDIMPNLRWLPTTSLEPDSKHRVFWLKELTLPVDHPFWSKHHPGDRWNCKCMLEQTDEPANPEVLAEIDAAPAHRGLENNPGKDGHLFNDTHPYFPANCKSCPFNKGFKNRLLTFFSNKKKDCYNCRNINEKLEEGLYGIKALPDVEPPMAHTYRQESSHVFVSPYHGANEIDENKEMAKFIVRKLGKKVYLLPRLDPLNLVENNLRSSLLPPGVPENKNSDFLIGGLTFEGKDMKNIEKALDYKQQHGKIINRIKVAKDQAENIILDIPKYISRKTISRSVRGYLKLSSQKRIIIVKHGTKCYIYT